ncbi:MAG: peptidoglycan-binding protein, partial [Woeseiaceae bacterium]
PLTREETAQYIEHRLKVAGAVGEVFDSGAKKETYRLSQGVPRLINVICDRALLGAYSRESRRVDRRIIRRAAAEVSGQLARSLWLRPVAAAAGLAGLAIIAATLWSSIQPSDVSPADIATNMDDTIAVAAAEVVDTEVLPEDPSPAEPITTSDVVEPEPTLSEQLDLARDLTNTSTALRSLFDTWDLSYDASRSGCSQASESGLACLYQRGSWASLRQMDRPAVLTLVDDGGDTHDVVLLAIHETTADLSIGGVRVTHSIDSITNAWFGQYLLLWRPPGGTAVSLGPNSTGTDVIWLRESLAAVDAQLASSKPNSAVYDGELEQLVRTFQRAHRLDVDGLAGQQTQIIINSLLAVDGTPRLNTALLARD